MNGITTCASCDLGLDHCHADLVEHGDGTTTCLDGCGGLRAVHDVLVSCGEVGMGCCDEQPADDLPVEPAWAA
jgi:hypothetical protein